MRKHIKLYFLINYQPFKLGIQYFGQIDNLLHLTIYISGKGETHRICIYSKILSYEN